MEQVFSYIIGLGAAVMMPIILPFWEYASVLNSERR